MRILAPFALTLATAGLLAISPPTWAQNSAQNPAGYGSAPAGDGLTTASSFGESQDMFPYSSSCGRWSGLYVGGDFLLIRPHFSEAVAFAHGTQGPTTYQIDAQPLSFDYAPSFRTYLGYHFNCSPDSIRFTFSHIRGDTTVDGTDPGPGQFLVDPFGNFVGTAFVIDTRDRRFGTAVSGGDHISTKATVNLNVYDLDLIHSFSQRSDWDFDWSVGVRIADLDQYYESVIALAGNPFSRGDFFVDFVGVGPRLGFDAKRRLGAEGRFSLLANAHGSLLVGEYDVRSSTTVIPANFSASQSEHPTRLIPVLEAELGAAWQASDSLCISAGWLFQAWFDMGTSGGTFGGFFNGADDANTMSFDGLTLRAEWKF